MNIEQYAVIRLRQIAYRTAFLAWACAFILIAIFVVAIDLDARLDRIESKIEEIINEN